VSNSIENLATVWVSIDLVCSQLGEGQWELPTGCPGWTVKDQVSHLVDYEARALGRPARWPEPGPLPHVKNELGRTNEIGVDARRRMPGAAVLGEFRAVTAGRLVQLRQLTGRDLAAQTMTPAGPGTVAAMLTLRVMDSWCHEQDIRRAVGAAGHVTGPAVDEALGYFAGFLPYLVGKRAAAPEGSKVAFLIGRRAPVAVEVAGGRGRIAADPHGATVSLAVPVATFAALVGGRGDVPDDAAVTGDEELGRRVLGSLGFLP
jgi:uncharacterized protein (TIGR03083 family)